MTNILYISMVLPYHNVANGGGKTFYYYIKGIQDDPAFHAALWAKRLPGEKFDDEFLSCVSHRFLENAPLSIKHPFIFMREIMSKINPFRKYGNTLRESIYRQVREYLSGTDAADFQVIVLEFTEMVLMAKEIRRIFPEAVIFASEHDVSFLGRKRAYQKSGNFLRRLHLYIQYKVRRRNELEALRYCDVVMPHNPKDRRLLAENGIPKDKMFVLTPYFDSRTVDRRPNHRDILFYGAMGRSENCEAVIWFLDHVMPRLANLDVHLIILGANPQQAILQRQSENVIVTGFVEDTTPYFETCMCMVAPLLNGAGIKIKVLEALAAGIPVLTNEIGIEGISARAGEDYFYCETPGEYEKIIRSMAAGAIDLAQVSENARSFIKRNYNLEQALRDYKQCVMNAVGKKNNYVG